MKNLSNSQKWEIVNRSIKEINEFNEYLNFNFMKVINNNFDSYRIEEMKDFSLEEIVLIYKNTFLTIQNNIGENRETEFDEYDFQDFIESEVDYYISNKENGDYEDQFIEELDIIKEIIETY